MLSLVTLTGSLGGILTSTMLVRKTTDMVDNFEDLFRYPKTRIAAEKHTYFERVLTVSDTHGSSATLLEIISNFGPALASCTRC